MIELGLGPLTPLDGGISLGNRVLDTELLTRSLNEVMLKHYMETGYRNPWNLYLSPAHRHDLLRLMDPPFYTCIIPPRPIEPSFNPTVSLGGLSLDFGQVKVFTEMWMIQDKKERLIFEALNDWPYKPFRLEIIEFLWSVPPPSSASPPKDPVPSVPSPPPEVPPQTGTGTFY